MSNRLIRFSVNAMKPLIGNGINAKILCRCGCGVEKRLYDKKGVARYFLPHHGQKKRIEAFWNFVDKRPIHGPASECWKWVGALGPDGYGHYISLRSAEFKTRRAHRIAWMLINNKILSPNELVCHSCDFPPCVNPKHLFIGTQADNMRDASKKFRLPHGEKNHFAKLNREQAREIKILFLNRIPYADIASQYGVTKSSVWYIGSGKTWKDINILQGRS